MRGIRADQPACGAQCLANIGVVAAVVTDGRFIQRGSGVISSTHPALVVRTAFIEEPESLVLVGCGELRQALRSKTVCLHARLAPLGRKGISFEVVCGERDCAEVQCDLSVEMVEHAAAES